MLFVTVFLGVLFIVSVYRITLGLSLPRRHRNLLMGLRFCLILLIAIAFIEPVFVFERLPAAMQQVPVLVDVSKSMQRFSSDPAVVQALSLFVQWNKSHPDKKKQFVFYCFGDSLRSLGKTSSCTWSDRRSFLPESMNDKILRQSVSIVVISDGNWSNTTLPVENYSDKNVTYLPLHGSMQYPYLQIELQDIPKASPIDSPFVVVIVLDGVVARDDTIIVNAVEKNSVIMQRKIPVSPGSVKKNIVFHLTNPAAGRHLYRFDARSIAETLFCSRYAFHSTLPDRFDYAIYTTQPTLDCRFIQLSLQRHQDFIELSSGNNKPLDLLVIFDWDGKAQNELTRLKPGGTALFIGSLPCDTTVSSNYAAGNLVRPLSGSPASPFDNFDFKTLPSPLRYVFCKGLSSTTGNILLSAVLPRTDRTGVDTLDVIFTGRYHHYNFIACAASDLWRWDFWPLGIASAEEHVFDYSDRLVALIKDMLDNGLSENFLLYPAATLSEYDSLPFCTIFPADLPIPSDIHLALTFITNGNRRYDTAFTMTATGGLHQIIRFKPLPAGHYRMEASAVSNKRRYVFVDSLFINQDRSEYSANGQNITLLEEIARPLTDFSEASLHTLFPSGSAEMKQPVKKAVQLNRNWPLLLMILLVFAAEWILRRIIKLD